MKQVRRIRKTAQENRLVRARLAAAPTDVTTTNAKVALIQELIPLGLLWVEDALQQEVAQLAGARYQRDNGQPGVVRYGTQPGSIYLADQKLGIAVPRVRDLAANREVALTTYRALRQPRGADDGVLRRILAGVSCRDYARCAEAVPQAFGLSASTVSRRFVQVSSRHLQDAARAPARGLRFRRRAARWEDVRGGDDGGGGRDYAERREDRAGAGRGGDRERDGVRRSPHGAR